ncbi:hypothetical protein [Prochlorococcus sp. MIT 0801]|uniref:hypothetical protein n=1 Tax=Prochlorococcus sp. MIT 0801 TaxID=1501269 RepID=UPI0004F7E497|nr:hypothetical protein [Prochlorococcus sp. MIT 0801]AIQ96136.1 hypothetical protein EW15_0044 [Prochlorococcus sp. MIT 0801]
MTLFTSGGVRCLLRVNVHFPFFNIFESAITLNLYSIPLIKNIYAENPNVEIPWCSHPYEFPFNRSRTRSGVKALQFLG